MFEMVMSGKIIHGPDIKLAFQKTDNDHSTFTYYNRNYIVYNEKALKNP